MGFKSWRGTVGVIKPTHRPGTLEEFIRLLPEGIGVIPMYVGIKTGKKEEFLEAMETMQARIAELASLKVDLIHPEGAALFVLRGYQGEAEIVRGLEEKYGIPIFTSAMTLVEASQALGIRKIVGITYNKGAVTETKIPYYTEAGLEVLAIEEMTVPFADAGRISSQEVYGVAKQLYLRHRDAEGILLFGSGWRILDVIEVLEQDLQIPVVHAIPARVWAVQKRLHVRQPLKGYGRLLEQMP